MPNELLSPSVTEALPRMPRQSKLRSSCDRCGAAKLRCDRGQPACGRCLSLRQPCVYGVSRKTGKPFRERLRQRDERATSCASGKNSHAASNDKDRINNSCNLDSGGFGHDQNSKQVLDGHPLTFTMAFDAPDTTHADSFQPLLPPTFTSLEFDDGLFSNMETGPISSLATPQSMSYPTPGTQTDASQTQVDDGTYLDRALLQPADCKGHDCFREAYDILGSLSFLRANNAHSSPESMTASTATPVPLDQMLRLNHEAIERLGHLLTCSCAVFPQLTMLYASIIFQVLIWYQQEAGCTQSDSWSHKAIRLDTAPVSHHMPLTGSSPSFGSGSGAESSRWSSTAASTISAWGGRNTPTLIQFPEPVAPAKIAIGTFNIEDQRVQTALKIQLLSGEMRKTGRLIDQFALHCLNGRCVTDECNFDGLHSLYQSLDAWIRSEHSRIANMMKARLTELNS